MSILLKLNGKKTAYKTVDGARTALIKAASQAEAAGRRDTAELIFEKGRYTLSSPFCLSAKESPALLSLDITLSGEGAEIDSLVSVTAEPQKSKEYFTYQLEKAKTGYPIFRELFLDGERIPMSVSSVWKNTDTLTPKERTGEVVREGFYAPIEIAKKLASAPIGSTELIVYLLWLYTSFHVESVDFDKTRDVDGETYVLIKPKKEEMEEFCRTCARHVNIGSAKLHLRNAPAFLTENTFAYDHTSGKLYVAPSDPENVGGRLEYPTLETLFELEGVEGVTVDGFAFSGVTDTYHSLHMVYPHQAGGIAGLGDHDDKSMRLKEAAVFARDVRGFTVKNCRFYGIGVNGVQVADRSARTLVKDCVFDYVSMCAVTVGNCSWNWQYEKNRTYNASVENNYFCRIAYEYPACPCIYIGQVDGLKITRNTVDGCAYSAISAGWNWMPVDWEIGERVNIRDAEISYNSFHNFMDLLHDGGAIYVVGSNCNRFSRSDRFNLMHHNYASLDEAGPAGDKYGYYLDGASSNWEMYDSVIINCHTPIYSQPHPEALSYHNSIHGIYSTKPYGLNIDAPQRDVIIKDFYLVSEGGDALLEAYPEAKQIKETTGASPELQPKRR